MGESWLVPFDLMIPSPINATWSYLLGFSWKRGLYFYVYVYMCIDYVTIFYNFIFFHLNSYIQSLIIVTDTMNSKCDPNVGYNG